MTTHRFYTGNVHDKNGSLHLAEHMWLHDERIVHQLLRVLRIRPNEQIILFDGKGDEVLYSIVQCEPHAVELQKITSLQPMHFEMNVTLAFALLKKDNTEVVIQKATELGVSTILPILSERTEKRSIDIDRARTIAIEASEQCGRHTIPEIHEPQSLQNVVGQLKDTHTIIAFNMTGERLVKGDKKIVLFIGPEGGWTPRELEYLQLQRAKIYSLGPSVLRAETACIAALSQLHVLD